MTFVYTDRDGAEIGFNWGAEWHTDRGVYMPPQFKPLTWTQPNGEKLTFTYEWKETHWTGYESLYVALIKSVSNNVGRTLTFANNYRTVSTNPYDWIWRIERVTDETGRYVEYLPTGCPPLLNWAGQGAATQVLACNTFTASLQDGTISKYTYQAGADSPDPAILTKPNFRLRRWFAPSNQTTALNTVAYDDLFRAKSVKDILTRETKYYTGSVSLGEYHNSAEVIDALNAINEYLYDERGSILRGIDPLGRTTAYEYDDIGRLITTIHPEGNAIRQTYDVRSNVLEKRNVAKATPAAPDIVTSTAYIEGATVKTCVNAKTCNKPATETDARLQVTNYTWNATYGDLTQLRLPPDPSGVRPQTDYTYTLTGPAGLQYRAMTAKTEKISSSVSVVTNYSYNPANRYVLQNSTVDPSGLNLITGFTFDTRGSLTAVDGPRTDVVDVTNYVWDTQRRLTFEIGADPDAAGALLRPATRHSYNLDGLRTKTERGTTTTATGAPFTLLENSSFEYDALGNKTRENVMNGATANPLTVTQYSYDAVYQLQCTNQRMNPAVFSSLGSDACALGTAGTFGDDRITRFTYDMAGNKTIEQRAFGTALQQDYASFTYTPNGKVETIRDAKNNRTTMEYDGQDRLARIRYPVEAAGADASVSAPNDIYDFCYDSGYTPPSGLGYEQYCFDANGNRTTMRRRDASILNFVYDNLNRETLKDIPGGTTADVYSGYDLLGRKLYARFASASGQGVDHAYDKAGRLITATTVGRTMAYQYDKAGNRTRVTWPDALYVDYTYDALNRMKELRENGATVAPGLLATYSYDNLGRRAGLTRGNAVTTSWGYDGASRLASLTQNPAGATDDQTYGYSYTPANGIASRSASNDSYAYAGFSVGSTSYGTANGLNQYPMVGAAAFGYDNRANLTSDGVRTMAYDVENRLLSVNGGGASLDVAYDPLGRLGETSSTGTVTQFLYAGDALVAEYNGAGTLLRRYVHGAGLDEPLMWYEGSATTDRRWLLGDERGSIIAETDGVGVASIYAYDAYGIPKNDIWTGSRFRYTGQIVLDAPAKLYHYKARVYDPKIGRFFQTDPIGYEDQLNLYAYVGNDPVNKNDPTGMCPSCIGAAIGGGIELGNQVFTQTVVEGKDLGDVSVDWVDVGIGAAAGATGASALKVAGKFFKAEAAAARAENAAARLATARERAQSGQIARRAAQARRAESAARAARSDTLKVAGAAAAVAAGKKAAQEATPPPEQRQNEKVPPPPPPPPKSDLWWKIW